MLTRAPSLPGVEFHAVVARCYRYWPVPLDCDPARDCARPCGLPMLMPGGSAPWRICSSWDRAAICWANSAVWMPWNRPSSQPTSCACAMRSSASVGTVSSVNGRVRRSSSSRSSGARPCSSSRIERLVDLLEPVAAGVVERCRAHLLEELLDHGADAHDLGGLLDHVGERFAPSRVRGRLAIGRLGPDRASAPAGWPSGCRRGRSRRPVHSSECVMSPSCRVAPRMLTRASGLARGTKFCCTDRHCGLAFDR